MMEQFSDDSRYLEWVATHPEGFVLNMRRSRDPNYVVLHRATCWTVSKSGHSDGAYTQHGYRKAVALTVDELRVVARQEGRSDGTFSKCCAHCYPLREQ